MKPALSPWLITMLWAPSGLADGAYQRLDGDLAPSIEVGASFGQRPAAPILQGRLLYLGSAGVQAHWKAPTKENPWSVAFGVEIRPLFLPRFFKNDEQGPPWWDLLLDSLHLGLATRLKPREFPGLDLSAGLEIPLQSSYAGFFLQGQVTHSWSHEAFFSPNGSTWTTVQLSMGYRVVLPAHLVDARDRILH